MIRLVSILVFSLSVVSLVFAEPEPFVYVATKNPVGDYQAFPDVCRLKDGRLFCVFYAGYEHISVPKPDCPRGGAVAGSFSSDNGKTWTESFIVVDTPFDDRDPSVTQLDDGRILVNFFVCSGPDMETALKSNPGPYYVATSLTESADGGKTWTSPRTLYEDYACSSPIRKLSTGRLILPLYIATKTPPNAWGVIGISDDKGATWSKPIDIPNGGRRLDAETDLIELKDGTLWALQRAEMASSLSKDHGETWSESKPVGFTGHCPYLLRTRENVILLATRIPATSLRLSRDECQTWSAPVQVDHFGGAYPSMAELEDGSVLIVYYEEGKLSKIRAKKFRVTDSGVEWLSLE